VLKRGLLEVPKDLFELVSGVETLVTRVLLLALSQPSENLSRPGDILAKYGCSNDLLAVIRSY